ncbi:MAG: hypothetical protein JWM27_4145 [Gemmatimonadetes bacterium]|nr:hypothetical protein [Gemmatimonadota bacterium]
MSPPPVVRGKLEGELLQKAESLSVAALFAIPALFSTLPAILFRVAAEREGIDPSAVFRGFTFAFLALPLGYLVLRGLGVPIIARIGVGLVSVLLALNVSAPATLAGLSLLLAFGFVVLRFATARVPQWGPGVVIGVVNTARSHLRLRVQSSRREAGLLVPLFLLVGLAVTGSFALRASERGVQGYESLFSSSRAILALDTALADQTHLLPRAGTIQVSETSALHRDMDRARLMGEIDCAANRYEEAADYLVGLAAAAPRDLRREPARGLPLDVEQCVRRRLRLRRSMPRDSLLTTMGSRVQRAAAILDSLLEYAATAPDSASQKLDSLQRAAGKQLASNLVTRVGELGALQEFATFRNSEAARATLFAIRAVETKKVRQKAGTVRRTLTNYQERRLATAREALARTYDRLRAIYLWLFGSAFACLVVGLLITYLQRFQRRPVRVATSLAILDDTYRLGIALVTLLAVPLLPKIDAANLDPRHPGEMFVQSSWYLPSFVAQQAKPIDEGPRDLTGGGPVYLMPEAERDTGTTRGGEPSTPSDTQADPLASLRERLDSLLKVLPETAVHVDTIFVAPKPAQPGPYSGQDTTLTKTLRGVRDSVDSLSRRSRAGRDSLRSLSRRSRTVGDSLNSLSRRLRIPPLRP